jgi:hypothetical protein
VRFPTLCAASSASSDEGAHHYHAATDRRDIDRARNPVAAGHAHFPQAAFEMLHVGLAHPLEPQRLDHRNDTLEARLHVIGERLELRRDRGQNLDDPAHGGDIA